MDTDTKPAIPFEDIVECANKSRSNSLLMHQAIKKLSISLPCLQSRGAPEEVQWAEKYNRLYFAYNYLNETALHESTRKRKNMNDLSVESEAVTVNLVAADIFGMYHQAYTRYVRAIRRCQEALNFIVNSEKIGKRLSINETEKQKVIKSIVENLVAIGHIAFNQDVGALQGQMADIHDRFCEKEMELQRQMKIKKKDRVNVANAPFEQFVVLHHKNIITRVLNGTTITAEEAFYLPRQL